MSTKFMHAYFAGACLVIGSAGPALAQNIQPASLTSSQLGGNTLTIRNKLGTLIVNLHSDSTYRVIAPDSLNRTASEGRWELNDEGLCVTQTNPAPPANASATNCIPVEGRRIGDFWDVEHPDAGVITYTLMKGLVDYRQVRLR